MAGSDRGPVASLAVAIVRFVACCAVLSIGTIPLTTAVFAVEMWWTPFVGALNLAGAAIAVDRDVDAVSLVTFALVAVLAFVLADSIVEIAVVEGLVASSTATTFGSVAVAYVVAVVVVRDDPVDRFRAFVDPERRGRARN